MVLFEFESYTDILEIRGRAKSNDDSRKIMVKHFSDINMKFENNKYVFQYT